MLVSDIQKLQKDQAPFESFDILNTVRLKEIIGDHKITEIYHLRYSTAGGEQIRLRPGTSI